MEVPSSVVAVGENVFYNCESLKSVTLPSSVESVGGSLFSGCISLKSIAINGKWKEIPESFCEGCDSLSEIQIPEGIESIGQKAFANCVSLKSVITPTSLQVIYAEAFDRCDNLENVVLQEGLTAIYHDAFGSDYDSYSPGYMERHLTSVIIPSTVTRIDSGAFCMGRSYINTQTNEISYDDNVYIFNNPGTLAIIDWRMAMAALVTLPVAVVPFLFLLKAFNRKYADYMASNNHVNSVIVEYVEGIEVVKAFNQTTSSYEKFSKAVKSFRDYTLDWYRSTWLPMNLILAILPTTLLGTLSVGLALYANGSLSVVNLCMCLILSLSIVASLLKLQGFINEIKSVQYNIENIESYLELPELSDSGKRIKLTNFEIDFNNVHFSYSGDRKDEVLHGIDLKLPEGRFTALVGPSGGGKSTVAKLIARFWDVNEGEIKIGGHNVKELSLKQLADTVSFVTQDNFLFNCSLKENIRLGNPNASDAEVYAAAKAACCEEFILRLENGYDTSAGDAGKKLSGGEKQRIAIARAILKNAPIVILDEATAFTDPENEDKIQQSIMALTKGKTLLVIAHRLSTIQNAHQIVVLKEGNVEATGTQAELLEHCALYRDMWSAHIGAKNWAVSQ